MTYLKWIKTVLFRVITRLVSEVQITQFRLKVDIYQFWRLGEKQWLSPYGDDLNWTKQATCQR